MCVHMGRCTRHTRARVLGCAYPLCVFSLAENFLRTRSKSHGPPSSFRELMRLSRPFERDGFLRFITIGLYNLIKTPSTSSLSRVLHTADKCKVVAIANYDQNVKQQCMDICVPFLLFELCLIKFSLYYVSQTILFNQSIYAHVYANTQREQTTYILYKRNMYNNLTQNFRLQ